MFADKRVLFSMVNVLTDKRGLLYVLPDKRGLFSPVNVGRTFSLADNETKNVNGTIQRHSVK